MDSLVADGVGPNAVVRTDAPTTLAMAEMSAYGSATYRFYFEGTSAPGVTAEIAVAAFAEPLDAVHVGTLALVLEPFATASESALATLPSSVLVMLDPNVRPAVIADREVYMARLERVLRRTNVVKVSDDDLAWLAPGANVIAAARQMLTLGPSVVFVTRGAEGVTVVLPDDEIDVPAPAVEIADTIGAGDAFSGGVLSWWLDNARASFADRESAVRAATFGCQVASLTASRAGAEPPYAAEVARTIAER
jgi:fructokinase